MYNSTRRSVIVVILIFLSMGIYGQHEGNRAYRVNKGAGASGEALGSLSGVVISSANSKPLEYAYLVLHKEIDSAIVTGGITSATGIFKMEKVPFGKYYLAITLIGHKPQKISNVFLGPKNPNKILDTIRLDQNTATLNTVEIKDKKSEVEYTLDKKVVNVEKNIVSAGGSAVDIMKAIPSITVDIDGNVSLKGSTNITVLVDGKPSGITGASRSAILDQIPASSIESIELISNPSAKYDPDGMSGIINIILKKKKERGYHGIFTLNAGTHDRYNGSIALNYSKNKFNVFANYDARLYNSTGWGDMKRFTHYDTIHIDTLDILNSDSTLLNHSVIRRKGFSQNFKLGTDFYMNDKNTFSISGLLSFSNDDHNDISKVQTLDNTGQIVGYYESPGTESSKDNDIDLNFDYKRTFAKKGEYLTADATYSKSHGTEDGTQDYYYYKSDLVTPLDVAPELQRTVTTDNNDVITLQSDYSNPLTKKSKFEAGAKSIIRSIDNDYLFQSYSPGINDWIDTIPLSNHFLYDEQIDAVYGTYSNAIGNLEFQAGLRGEMALTKSTQKTTSQEFRKNYYSLFPSVHLNLNLKNDNSLQLSYSRRVNRPNYWMLNPFVEIAIKDVRRYGNPYLTPEYIDSYELGHMKYWKHTSVNSSLFYKQINNAIQHFITIDTNGVQNVTSKNIATGTSYGLEFILTQDIFAWWKVNGTFSYFKTVMKGTQDESNLTNSNYSWTAKFNTTMTILKNLDIQMTGNYRSPTVTLQGGMKAMYYADIAMKKVIFKNASLTLRVSDIFDTQKFQMTSSSTDPVTGIYYDLQNTRKRDSRVVYLGFTYKINGGVKSKDKKPAFEVPNEGEGNDF